MVTLVVLELLIAVISLVGPTSSCTFMQDLNVKATGCGTGFGLFRDNRVGVPCPWLELRRPTLE